MKKKLLLLFSLVLCMALLAGCGKKDDEGTVLPEDNIQQLKDEAVLNFENWLEADFALAETYTLYFTEEQRTQFKEWAELKERLGELQSQKEPSFKFDGKEEIATTVIEATFENAKITYTLKEKLVRSGDGQYRFSLEETNVNEVESQSQIMGKALLNTLMGMGTVFCVLVLISLVISSFGLIAKSQAKKQEKQKAVEQANAPVQIGVLPPAPEENLVDDLELVAVITAAIMASMGDEAPAEGLVVRSIRKRNASSWKNA